jgi:ankyrin repeat protein
MANHLQKSAPRIWQVQCHGGKHSTIFWPHRPSTAFRRQKDPSGTETPVSAKVATLAKYPFGAPSAQDKDGWSPLHRASDEGDVELARVLLERGVDATAQDNDGWTPLHRASDGGWYKCELVNSTQGKVWTR